MISVTKSVLRCCTSWIILLAIIFFVNWHEGSRLQEKVTFLTEEIERVHSEHHHMSGVLGQIPILNLLVKDLPNLDLGKERFTSTFCLPRGSVYCNYLKVQHLLYLRQLVKDELPSGAHINGLEDVWTETLRFWCGAFLQVIVSLLFIILNILWKYNLLPKRKSSTLEVSHPYPSTLTCRYDDRFSRLQGHELDPLSSLVPEGVKTVALLPREYLSHCVGKGSGSIVHHLSHSDLKDYPPLCIKFMEPWGEKQHIMATIEAINLKNLEGIPGLPKPIAVCFEPHSLVMTQHGSTTLERLMHSTPLPDHIYIEIMKRVIITLQAIHNRGYIYNNVKTNNVCVDLDRENNVVKEVALVGFQFLAQPKDHDHDFFEEIEK